MKRIIVLIFIAFVTNTVYAVDLKPFEKLVNSFYDCGKVTNAIATQWTDWQTGVIVKCSNTKRYVILKAGQNKHSVKPILLDPFDPAEIAQQKQAEEFKLRLRQELK